MRALVLALLTAVLVGCAAPPDDSAEGSVPGSRPGERLTDALVYSGAGSWGPEVDSLLRLLFDRGATYEQADSARLDAMTLEDLARYRLLIIPGGSAAAITASLKRETRARLREAVQREGLNYLGFCAGAWIGVAPPPERPDDDVIYGIGVAPGPVLGPSPLAASGRAYTMSVAHGADGSRRSLLWFGGPTTPDVRGGVVTRYENGAPAITQVRSGAGLVTLSGFHPAVRPAVIESLALSDADGPDYDFAWKLVQSSIEGSALPAF